MIDSLKKYIENRIQLVKFDLISILANLSANLISSFFILIILLITLTMFSFSIAYLFGQYFDNTALGFAAVGGIYLLVFIIYMSFVKDKIDKKVKDKIVQAAFDAEKEIKKKKDE
jgi:hypothetical protein